MKALQIIFIKLIIFNLYALEYDPGILQGFYLPDIPSPHRNTECNSRIIEVNDPKNLWSALEPYTRGDKPTLVVTDIDGTLGRCQDPHLDETIYNINIAIRRILIPQSEHLSPYFGLFNDHIKFMKKTTMEPLDIENSVKTVIDNLQLCNIPIIGATSRSVNYNAITMRHLQKDLSIDLEKTSHIINTPVDFQYPPSSPPCSFKNNILFCQGGNKAERLLTLLKELKLNYADLRIIVLEDNKDNLIAMYNIFHEQAILIYLNIPHSESDKLLNKTLIQQSLADALDYQSELKDTTYQNLKKLNVNSEHLMTLINTIFNLPYPKNVPLTKKTINSLAPIESFAKQVDATTKERILAELLILLKNTKNNVPAFTFIDKGYLTIYLKQRAIHIEEYLFPLKFLYPCNERLLRRITNQLDLAPNKLLLRTLSLPYLRTNSPPESQTASDHFDFPLEQQSP